MATRARILVINPNTTASITALATAHIRRVVPESIELRSVTGRFGAAYIATEAAFAIGAHAALDAYAAHGADCDAVLLACFGDPGLAAVRDVAPVPVVGLAQSCMEQAAALGRYAIVTGGVRWKPMLEAFAAQWGWRDALTAIETVALSGAEIAADPDAAIDVLAAACRRASEAGTKDDPVRTVILGGAGLAGLAVRVQSQVPIPVWDSVEIGGRAAAAAVVAAIARRSDPDAHPECRSGVGSVGLSEPLARLLGDGKSSFVTKN